MPEENIKTYIVDASLVLAYLLPDERSEPVSQVFQNYIQGKVNFAAPGILSYEVLSGLKNAMGKRLNKQEAYNLIEDFLNLTIAFVEIDLKGVFNLSIENNLSAYDACYLYLSQNKKIPLLTLDQTLQKLA